MRAPTSIEACRAARVTGRRSALAAARSYGRAYGAAPRRLARSLGRRVATPQPLRLPQHAPGCARRNSMSAARGARRGCACGAVPRDARGTRACIPFPAEFHLSSRRFLWTVASQPATAGIAALACSPVRCSPSAALRCGFRARPSVACWQAPFVHSDGMKGETRNRSQQLNADPQIHAQLRTKDEP